MGYAIPKEMKNSTLQRRGSRARIVWDLAKNVTDHLVDVAPALAVQLAC